MGSHLIDGKFQSDKYPTTPLGKVPLSCSDSTAQDLLWEYAQRRRLVDSEFADDLECALVNAGYVPGQEKRCACGPRRIEVSWSDETFLPRFGCMTCNKWDSEPRLRKP